MADVLVQAQPSNTALAATPAAGAPAAAAPAGADAPARFRLRRGRQHGLQLLGGLVRSVHLPVDLKEPATKSLRPAAALQPLILGNREGLQ